MKEKIILCFYQLKKNYLQEKSASECGKNSLSNSNSVFFLYKTHEDCDLKNLYDE